MTAGRTSKDDGIAQVFPAHDQRGGAGAGEMPPGFACP